jgi:hypothetical protein|tara:strand:+ start:54 stop:269 length:216 start_codon:yes stop_codon:yes gene_type:complete
MGLILIMTKSTIKVTMQRVTVQEHVFEVEIPDGSFDDSIDCISEDAHEQAANFDWRNVSSGSAEYEVTEIG